MKTKRPKTIGELQKAAGVPSDTVRDAVSGKNKRDDAHVVNHITDLGKAELAEQLAGAPSLPDDVIEVMSALCRSLVRLKNKGATTEGDNARLEDAQAVLKKYVKPTTEGRLVQSNEV
jgi:hypothetical protein